MNRRTRFTVLYALLLILPLSFTAPATAGDLEVVESETGFYYTIKKGDTLWDLSQHFNDSSWLWPELWKENDQISNPHWIFPGERIRLYKKSGAQIISKTEPTAAIEIATVQPAVEKKKPAPFFVFSSIDRVGFIRKPPVAPSGTIFEVQGAKVMISEGDIVYIRPSADSVENAFIAGSRHTVFRYMKPTDERDSTETIGTQHYLLGIVEVTQKNPDIVIAKVLKSFRPMQADDLVMPYNQQPYQIEVKPSTPGIEGQIIASEEHTKLTGDFMLAFIDKGQADNIAVGQQYSIYNRKNKEDGKKGTVHLPPVDFGTLLVLHTEQTTSTVVITSSQGHISPGERFRTPIE